MTRAECLAWLRRYAGVRGKACEEWVIRFMLATGAGLKRDADG